MKRNKVGLLQVSLSTMMVLALAFSSCAKEPLSHQMPGGDGMEVRVTFPQHLATRDAIDGTEDENRLDSVTILIFNADGSELETALSVDVTANNTTLSVTQPKWDKEKTLTIRPVISPSSPKKIYAIANWGKTDFAKGSYTEESLKSELTTITSVEELNGTAAYPMLMSGSKQIENPIAVSYRVVIDMARQVAKFKTTLRITKEAQQNMPNIEWLVDRVKITVGNIPSKFYVIGQGKRVEGSTPLHSTPMAMEDPKPTDTTQTFPATNELSWGHSIYVSENPINNYDGGEDATYMILQLPYKNRITGVVEEHNYYKIFAYKYNDDDMDSSWNVLRNTIYNFLIKITGIGTSFNTLAPDVNVENVLTVTDWTKTIIDMEATTRYFNIDRARLGLPLEKGSLTSTISTNVTDWKLVNTAGETILSFVGSKQTAVVDNISYVLSGTVTAAKITASKEASEGRFATQNMHIIAKNLKVPFTVSPDVGFILNDVLIKEGWPTDKLHPNGLQLAKRGYRIYPDGVAGTDDRSYVWKTEQTTTPGVDKTSKTDGSDAKLGMGKQSTDAMMLQPELHPAAAYCRGMGEEWYLPSIAEMRLIIKHMDLIGDSYRFTDWEYWTSTEIKYYSSWTLYVNTGSSTNNFLKDRSNRVRCVRGI